MAATLVAFWPALRNGFVNYDDDVYVYGNPQVARGLNAESVPWAFTHSHGGNWHPLTWLSHMADCELFGLKPLGHHLTSILLQAASAVILFLALWEMSGARLPSAFAAALFAVHPLRVESVAWVAERKDVLSGLFFMLTLWAYARAARAPAKSFARRWPVVLFFALGLLSKPTLVTTPFVLLLLDVWPLKRFGIVPVKRLIAEKIPLFALSAAACFVTAFVQQGSIQPMARLPIAMRLGNALVSYVTYLRQMVWPAHLAVLYPFPEDGNPLWKVLAAFFFLVLVSGVFFALRRERPYLLVGWLWYLGMLVPMIGVVQAGAQAHADRYTYLPQIGLCVLAAWALADFRTVPGQARVGAAVLILVALIVCTRRQVAWWRDGETLWAHAIACTARNGVAENNLGDILIGQGKVDEAIVHFRNAVEYQPNFAFAYSNLGNAFAAKGEFDQAAAWDERAIRVEPAYAEAHFNFGNTLLRMGRTDAAIAQYEDAVRIRFDYAEARANLGAALLRSGRLDAAILEDRAAIEFDPGNPAIRRNLEIALAAKAHSTIKSGPVTP